MSLLIVHITWLMFSSCYKETVQNRLQVPSLQCYTRCPHSLYETVHLSHALESYPCVADKEPSPQRCPEDCSLLPISLQTLFLWQDKFYNVIHLPGFPTPRKSGWGQASPEIPSLSSFSTSPASLSHLEVSPESFPSINHVYKNRLSSGSRNLM